MRVISADSHMMEPPDLWQERLDKNKPWGIGWLTHALDDQFYRAQSLSGGSQ